ncbi:efflux RND transporter permease subunit [Halomonas beimenensis]|uniref:efflux RND transporter permease subunit n=1 Tax=Halomonas beimenensis TaxID=475662 RepID=UPI0036122EDE
MSRRYGRLLARLLHHRALFLAAMALTLVAGVAMMQLVPQKFFPDSDRNQVLVTLDFPSDIAENATDRRIQALSRELREAPGLAPDVTGVAAYAGFGGPRFVLSLTPIDPAPNKGFLVLNVSGPRPGRGRDPRHRDYYWPPATPISRPRSRGCSSAPRTAPCCRSR